jgi:Arc/MetJ-type ribon-helix-helix transcriptional regulator
VPWPADAETHGAPRLTVSRPSEIVDFVRTAKANQSNTKETMSNNAKSQFTNRLTVHITQAMDHRLEQIASQRDEPKAEVVRAALRAYLDEQEDLIGSRRHFTKMFQRRIDDLERLTVIGLLTNIQVLHILYERVKREPYELGNLMHDMIETGIKSEDTLRMLVEGVRRQNTKPPAK